MRADTWIVVPALLLATSMQEPAKPRLERDPQIAMLVSEASAAPPEFAADILIRVAESPKVPDADWKRELLDEAFMLAYSAQQPYRFVSTVVSPDTRQGAEALAGDTPLNRVSLQVRVAEAMRYVDPERARELFGWIDLNHDAATCESPLAPALDEYYLALATIARLTPPDDTTGRDEALRFLEAFLWYARLPSDMPAVVKAIRRFRPTREEAQYLETVVRSIFENSERDPRGFAASALEVVSKVGDLDEADRALGINGSYLLSTLRRYLVTQLTGPRCGDSTSEGPAVDNFNAIVRRRQTWFDGVASLAASDARPSRLLGAVRIVPYWRTAESRRLHDDAVRLRGTPRQPVTDAVRRTAAWLAQADRHLTDVQQWTGARETAERDYFYQKGVLFAGLIDLTPPGATRTRTLRAFADFLHQSDAERRRPLWFLFANRLIELTRSADAPVALSALETSNDRILALYAHAARVLPRDQRTN